MPAVLWEEGWERQALKGGKTSDIDLAAHLQGTTPALPPWHEDLLGVVSDLALLLCGGFFLMVS